MSPFVLCLSPSSNCSVVASFPYRVATHPMKDLLFVVWWIVLELVAEGCWLLALRHSTHQHSARSSIGRSISGCGMFTVCPSTVMDPLVCPSIHSLSVQSRLSTRYLAGALAPALALQLRWIRLDITRTMTVNPTATAPLPLRYNLPSNVSSNCHIGSSGRGSHTGCIVVVMDWR